MARTLGARRRLTDAAADRVPVLRKYCLPSSQNEAALACRAGGLAVAAAMLDGAAGSGLVRAADLSVTRNFELEALQEAVRWPNPTPGTVLTLAGQFMASRRDDEGYRFFQERATGQPDQPLLFALDGFF